MPTAIRETETQVDFLTSDFVTVYRAICLLAYFWFCLRPSLIIAFFALFQVVERALALAPFPPIAPPMPPDIVLAITPPTVIFSPLTSCSAT